VRRTGDDAPSDDWWRRAALYQVYVPSFADSDGDGVGDLDGVRERLGYLDLLGVDALLLTEFLRSPTDIDPRCGDLDAFDRLVEEAGRNGLQVMTDLTATDTELERTLRFWLERSVAGFRVEGGMPGSHRLVREVLDEYPGTFAAGEIWLADDERLYPRPDELHLGVNFRLVLAGFDAVELRTSIDASLDTAAMADLPPTWTLSNHDVIRPATRYGDGQLGTHRARATALVELGLPGVVYLYNGEELGLPNWSAHDPASRDGCRVPLPWEGAEPPFGFSAGASTWLPMPQEWAKLTVERQLEDADSTLSLYRQALDLRKTHPAFAGAELEWYGAPAGCFAYRRKGGGLVCVLNASDTAVPLPAGELLLASGSVTDRRLPPNTAAWLV
jgi:glycosidase